MFTFPWQRILFLLCVLNAAVASAQSLAALPPQEERFWENHEGQSIRATLLEIDTETRTARMRREDGFHFTLPWERFSKSDQGFLETIAKKSAEKSEKESESNFDPFKRGGPSADTTETQSPPAAAAPAPTPTELPDKLELKGVPMVVQKGNFCVPASAAMIAGYHGMKTDQDEVAQLSSESSISNEGTYPRDMLLAMEKLGFSGRPLYWNDDATFFATALPAIQRALVETGPVYISFKPAVFGGMGHGCVIVGFDQRRKELLFYNPWGNEFKRKYSLVATQGSGVVLIDPPEPAPVASEDFIEEVERTFPRFEGEGNVLQLTARLKHAGLTAELVWCSRRDSREVRRFAEDTAREDGRKILKLAFDRNPAVLIPYSPKGNTEKYFFVTRPPDGGARFMVWEITKSGWSKPELKPLGRLTREWATRFPPETPDGSPLWELPMIELR